MKNIITIFILLALCGNALAQGSFTVTNWSRIGNFIYNKAADSVGIIIGTDTTWFTTNIIRRGLDTVSTLGPTIEGDELGTGLLDSITAAYDSSQAGLLNPADPNVDTAAWNAGGSGIWVVSNDTAFLVDGDGDTLAAFLDDDAGNVWWQVATEDQTLKIKLDSLDIGGTVLTDLSSAEIYTAVGQLRFMPQCVKGVHVDSTAQNFIFDAAYEGTSASEDNRYSTHTWVWGEIEDSLNEYSLTSAIASLYPDTAETVDTIQGVLTEGGYLTNSKFSDSSIALLNATAWRLFYSNATTTAIQELALGSDGTYLKSNGASANPTWATPGGAGFNWTDSTGFLVGWGGVAKSVVNDTNYFRFEGSSDFDTSGGSVSIAAANSATWAGRVSDETGTGVWVFGTSPTFTTDLECPLIIGGTATTSDLSLKTTSGVGETGADMHFLVGDDGAIEAMTILNDGKVGIRETSPYFHLIVAENSGEDGPTIGMKRIDAAVGVDNRIGRFAVMGGETGTGNTIVGSICIDSDVGWTSTSSPTRMEFSTTNDGSTVKTEKMRITNDGSVGIGTESPGELLHVSANNAALKLEDDSGNDAVINVGNSQLCIAIDPDDTIASSDICFDIDGAEVARFHASTNFGIGTLSPPERLSVVGNIATGDTTAGDVDVFHYFSKDGDWLAEWLVWNDGNARFELSDDFYVAGNISLTGSIAGYFDTAAVVDTAQALDNTVLSKIRDTVMAVLDTIWFGMTIDNPDGLTKDSVMVLAVDAEWAPSGITLLSVGIKTWAATSYSVDFIEFTEPGDGGTESAIETVATSSSREAEDDGTLTDADIAAGSIIVVDLPATDIDELMVWGTYTID